MHLRRSLWGSLLLLLAQINSYVRAHVESCAGACELAIGSARFADSEASSGYYPLRCASRMRASSVYLCMKIHCRANEISIGWARLNHDCERYGNITLPPYAIISNYTDADVSHLRRLNVSDNDADLLFNEPVLPDRTLFDVAFRTKDAWNNSVRTRHLYGNAMFYFWAIVVAFGFISRFVGTSGTSRVTSINEKHPQQPSSFRKRLGLLAQAYITIPATFSQHCAQPLGWATIPPRLQSALLLAFAITNVVLCCVSYNVFKGNLYWPPFVQWMRYIGDRTGILATANLPLIWLFATRNNIVLFITGWSFDTAMQFHRWMGRISTAEALVHSVAYSLLVLHDGRFLRQWTLKYWNMGALATVVMCALCLASLYPIRKYRYELFLFIHVSLGIFTLIGMWYHVEIFGGDYNWYLWPCVLVWLADRCGRIARLAYLNFPFHESDLRYDEASNAVWLSVPVARPVQPRPGEYYFLYLLHDRTFYQSHPFTISSWSKGSGRMRTDLNFIIRPYDGFTRRIAELARKSTSIHSGGHSCRQARVLVEGPHGTNHNLRNHNFVAFIVGGTGVAIALAYLNEIFRACEDPLRVYKARCIRIVWAVQKLAMFEQVLETELRPLFDGLIAEGRSLPFRLEIDVFVTRPQLTSRTAQVVTKLGSPREVTEQAEEASSEQSPLLSPSSSMDATTRSQSPCMLPSLAQKYDLPGNVHLTLHSNERPEIAAIVERACCWQFDDMPRCRDDHTASNDCCSYEYCGCSVVEPERVPRLCCHATKQQSRPRIAIISCGPAKLSDSVRGAVADTLQRSKFGEIGDVDFWSESYSW